MPITVRKWWINRTAKEIEARNKAASTKGSDDKPKGPPPWARGPQGTK